MLRFYNNMGLCAIILTSIGPPRVPEFVYGINQTYTSNTYFIIIVIIIIEQMWFKRGSVNVANKKSTWVDGLCYSAREVAKLVIRGRNWVAALKKNSLEVSFERQLCCWCCNAGRRTVPDTRSGDGKSAVADCGKRHWEASTHVDMFCWSARTYDALQEPGTTAGTCETSAFSCFHLKIDK